MSDSEVEYDIAGALNPENDSSEDDWSSGSESDDGEIQDIVSDDEEEEITTANKDEPGTMSFPSLELSDDEDEDEEGNRKTKKSSDDISEYFGAPQLKKKNAGSFAGLGLSAGTLKNIARKGFKQPTPIQRKTIPLVLEGKDVVGMARTGSGKTAAFVLPMLEKLKVHSAKVGARAVILSPSRELAMQTLKVVKDFSAGTDLRLAMLVGGDSLEEQFKMMMSNPDIIIATPGRFLHLKVEMELSLSSVEYICFDEADRLFELGFGEQMNELLASLPSNRQTLLFSATLPKTLVEFAKAGLHDPVLVRLDAETKLPEHLEMTFFSVKENQRDACLAFILKEVIKMPFATAEQLKELERLDERALDDGERDEQDKEKRMKRPKFKKERLPPAHELPSEKSTIVFCPTKHHVEYVIVLLQELGYAVSYIYGTLDQHARKNQLYRFRTGKTSILVVTDVAARGIDVPILANVINYSLPPSPKVFIHRVGRTARAGNRGWAYSIIKDNDIPYLLDLEVFLGRKLLTPRLFKQQNPDPNAEPDYVNTLTIGAPPRQAIEIHGEELTQMVKDSYELQQLSDVAVKGERMYNKTKGSASQESAKRSKQIMALGWDDHHLMFGEDGESAKDALLARLGQKRIRETVFEFRKSKTTSGAEMMATRRAQLAPIQRRAEEKKAIQEKERLAGLVHTQDAEIARSTEEDLATEADLTGFTTEEDLRAAKKSKKRSFRDSENFMSHYAPTNDDKGYAVGNFAGAASNATFDLINDGSEMQQKQGMKWDKKKGKFINAGSEGGKKFIRGEGGQRIAASFRSGRFDKWKAAHKVGNLKIGSLEESGPGSSTNRVLSAREFKHNKNEAPKRADKYRDDFHKQKSKVAVAKEDGRIQKPQPKSELKSTSDVRKGRMLAEKRKLKNARPSTRGGGGGRGGRGGGRGGGSGRGGGGGRGGRGGR